MRMLVCSAATAAALLCAAAEAGSTSVNANLANWGANDASGGGSSTPTLVFTHNFVLPPIVSIDSISFQLSHSFLSDVHLVLRSPAAITYVLAQGDGPGGSAYQGPADGSDLGDGGSDLAGLSTYTFADLGVVFNDGVDGGTAPSGTYAALQWPPGSSPSGFWTVEVWDVWDTLDDGALGTITINFTAGTVTGAVLLLLSGGCIEVPVEDCQLLGGSFTAGQSCADANCTDTGACCLPEGGCISGFSFPDCIVLGGVFHEGEGCGACNAPATGACCFNVGALSVCEDLTAVACAGVGGTYHGNGTSCGAAGAICCPAQCPGDVNGSGTVDGADLGMLLGAWNGDDACADLDQSGTVDGADLGILLGNWGPCGG